MKLDIPYMEHMGYELGFNANMDSKNGLVFRHAIFEYQIFFLPIVNDLHGARGEE